ncbi:MAG: hypothetical protein QOJ16_149 [Acidobacteriota bacterium]|jgi:hypothetical protein|nr:hypothetical protein [Acidobacteriota bacterium]
MSSEQFFGALFLVAGSFVVLYGVRLFVETRAFFRRAGRSMGTVVRRVLSKPASWQPALYHPVVLFHTQEGEQILLEVADPMVDIRCRVGTTLPLAYDGSDPKRVKVGMRQWYDVAMVFYLGILVSAAGIVLTYQHLH